MTGDLLLWCLLEQKIQPSLCETAADNSPGKAKRSRFDLNQPKRPSWEQRSGRKFKTTDYEREFKRHWLKRTSGEHLMQSSTPSGTTADPRLCQTCFLKSPRLLKALGNLFSCCNALLGSNNWICKSEAVKETDYRKSNTYSSSTPFFFRYS